MKGIGLIVKEAMGSLINAHTTPFKEVRYFHPRGKKMPNGCHYQRGGFLKECKINRESFIPSESVYNGHNNLKDHNGGILVFPTDVDSTIVNGIHDAANQFNGESKHIEKRITAYYIGNHFKGRYVGHQGEIYDSNSLSLEIDGLSSRHLYTFALMLAHKNQLSFLIKDLNTDKIYITRTIKIISTIYYELFPTRHTSRIYKA